MIKKLTGIVALLAALAIMALTIIGHDKYRSMIFGTEARDTAGAVTPSEPPSSGSEDTALQAADSVQVDIPSPL